jgi:hypothetical protein
LDGVKPLLYWKKFRIFFNLLFSLSLNWYHIKGINSKRFTIINCLTINKYVVLCQKIGRLKNEFQQQNQNLQKSYEDIFASCLFFASFWRIINCWQSNWELTLSYQSSAFSKPLPWTHTKKNILLFLTIFLNDLADKLNFSSVQTLLRFFFLKV